jgi:ribosome-associated translation inhibitor RaiA
MKTHKIEFKSSVEGPTNELDKYLAGRIEKIGKDFGAVESCEIIIDKKNDTDNNCEVYAYLGVPRHIYRAGSVKKSFYQAAEKVFEDLYSQLNASGWALS